VFKKPSVALLSTGNELVDLHREPQSSSNDEWGGVFDTNRPSLQSVLESLGYDVIDLGIAPDTSVDSFSTL
jgi:gephyrin